MKDAPTKFRKEEYVSNMVQRPILVVMKDVPTMFRKEESVSGMVLR